MHDFQLHSSFLQYHCKILQTLKKCFHAFQQSGLVEFVSSTPWGLVLTTSPSKSAKLVRESARKFNKSYNPGVLCSAFPSSQQGPNEGPPTHSDVPRNLGNDAIVLHASFVNSQTNYSHYSWSPAVDPTQLTSPTVVNQSKSHYVDAVHCPASIPSA